MRKNLKNIIKILGISFAGLCLVCTNIIAASPPSSLHFDDGGHNVGGGAYAKFNYQLHLQSVNEIKGTATYKLGEWFSITGASTRIYSDYVYLTNRNVTNQYIGVFDAYNGWQSPGTYQRGVWFSVTLTSGSNKIRIAGAEGSVEGTGDAIINVSLDKIGHDPIVHGVDGTWTAGEVSSGKRTWQSLYSDGATGSEEGNKQPTATGFTYSDQDEQTTPVGAYANVPIANNSYIDQIQKQNADGSWSTVASSDWTVMDNPGLYWLKSCTSDQAGYTACGTRYVTVKQKKYNVKYNGNTSTSGSMSNSEHTYDETKALTSNSYAKTGYHFKDWNTKADGTGTSYTNGQLVKNLSSIDGAIVNLYAQWIPNSYTVKYHGNGAAFGSTPTSYHIYDEAKALNMNEFERSGWKFMSWNTKSDGTGTRYTDRQTVKNLTNVNNAAIHLYAQWDQAPSLTVKNHTYYDSEITQAQWQSSLRFKGISASDREDGNLTSKIKVIEDLTEVDKPGVYPILYQVTDSVGQTTTKSAEVNILYNHPPVITAKSKVYHENELTPEEWQDEIMKEVSGSDQEDGNVTNKIRVVKDTVKPDVPGGYEVTYEVTDSLGKTTQKTIDVTILENWQPKIQIFAGNKRFIEGQYTQEEWENEIRMLGVSAHDREDADLTDKIVIQQDTTDPSKRGLYEVKYTVTDRWGKSAEKRVSVIVEPNDPPEIFAYDKYFTVHDHITDQDLLKNVTAVDDRDGNISDDVKIVASEVKEGVIGTYQVTYRVSDQFGKTTEKTVNVHIREQGSTPTPSEPSLPEEGDALHLWNGREFAQLTITKEMEASLFDQDAYKDVVFGVYAAEDIIYNDKVVLTKDSLVGIGKVDEHKQIHVMLYHAGHYYLQEIKTNDRYQLDMNKYYFMFE